MELRVGVGRGDWTGTRCYNASPNVHFTLFYYYKTLNTTFLLSQSTK